MFTPLTVVQNTSEKMRCSITKAVLTDSSDVIPSIVFGPLFRRSPLKVFGRAAPGHFLEEVVEITNGVRGARIWHLKICKKSGKFYSAPHGGTRTHDRVRVFKRLEGDGKNEISGTPASTFKAQYTGHE